MNNETNAHNFLISRRSRITPSDVGLPTYGERRRVPGLRREEVAMLAGISADYYGRLERGELRGVSNSVLESLTQALQLNEDEKSHLYNLARSANQEPVKARQKNKNFGHILGQMTGVAAIILDPLLNIKQTNPLGHELYKPVFKNQEWENNFARFLFQDSESRILFPQWDEVANDTVSLIRSASGENPHSDQLRKLLEHLTQEHEFNERWQTHNVYYHKSGTKMFHHPDTGNFILNFETATLLSDPHSTLILYSSQQEHQKESALNILQKKL
ncbi:helix-turn-helix transcriptional regulator [Corynebacterium lowii]|uniref:helix-turn-helix transcriptional regulator n=1 Tax=Corynebacterium lowii TaxID=1544413 RepID=UPI0008517496|nr:helix-turn-helix transcriptional regulator [Corynebacterium lowii]MDP9852678.1 transcriptional regulator with XRE-family HTH domain [Corynebacterium lowii]